jgi:hypothetical protein
MGDSTIRNFRIVRTEGNREVARNIEYYNLDAIISVGYRVNSKRATQFRQWATHVLREFAIKGYVLDKEMAEKSQVRCQRSLQRVNLRSTALFRTGYMKATLTGC